MKKLTHAKYGFSVVLEENEINEIVIESPVVLSELARELTMQSEGQEGAFVLSEEGKLLAIDKNMVFIKDPFTLDVNQRRMLSKLYSQLDQYVMESLENERIHFHQAFIRYMDSVCAKSDLFLTYDMEPECQEILKLAKLRIDLEAENLLDQIVEYMRVCVELLHIELYVFLNLKLFLSEEELAALYSECFQRKIHLVLIEAVYRQKRLEENVCIIDKDKCIIYL